MAKPNASPSPGFLSKYLGASKKSESGKKSGLFGKMKKKDK